MSRPNERPSKRWVECPSDASAVRRWSAPVHAVRHLLARRHFAVPLCAATLLVPTGYMIDNGHGRMTVSICSGFGPATMTMDMPGMHGGMPDRGKAEMPCALPGLSVAMLGSIDPVQLAALIVFILALGLIATIPPTPSRPA